MPVSASDDVARIAAPSVAQQALWVLCQVTPDEPVYNESNVFRLKGMLDVGALVNALNEIVRRHESLRTRFRIVDGAPVQEILSELELPVEITDLSLVADDAREAQARRHARDEIRAPFDLEQGPLIRVRLLRLKEDEHWLLQTMHHIIRDGTSIVIFAKDLSALYSAYRSGRPSPLPALPTQYADFASRQREWLAGPDAQAQLAYWKQVLADLPALELPTDRPRPPVPSGRGGQVALELDELLTRKLKELRLQEGTTLFTTVLAAFQVLLYRYSGQDDVAVGVPVAGRSRFGAQDVIGYFVNVLVLRGNLAGEPTFRQYLAQVRQRSQEAYAHQDVPFAKLVEELACTHDPSRNPLFQVSLVKGTEVRERPALEGLVVEDLDLRGPEIVKFDLSFSVVEERGGLKVVIDYATDLFDAATIERMAGHWRTLLESIVADPDERISRLPLLSAAERQPLFTAAEHQPLPPPQIATAESTHRCLHELFEAQVRRTPDATALVYEGEPLSYAELNARANRLAHHLRTLGVGAETLVAIAMERSLELVVGLVGILKAAAAYVPLDPSYPAARLAFMLEDTRAPVLLTQERLLGRLPTYAGRTVCLDRDWASIATQPDSDPLPGAAADNLAYVIYTSGSTGQPKGVMVEHRSVVNYLSWIRQGFSLAASDRVLQKTPLGFDASVEEIFFPLVSGAVLVIARPDLHPAMADMMKLIHSEQISVLQVVPSLLGALLDQADFRRCASLRLILCGGEVLSPELVRRLHDASDAELVNLYGPTETTISSTFWRCRPDVVRATVSIGHPISNTRVIVVDRNLQPVPTGTAGELCIGGAGVARGYFNQPALTAHCFVADPWSSDPQARLYKTGDRARCLPDGSLEFLGRSDDQIKVRGFRIEPGEIEATLRQHEAIREAIVSASEDRLGDKRIVAYVVPTRGHSLSADELRGFLLHRLPAYMVPSAFLTLEALPLGPGGKVDRKLLPDFTPELELGARPHVSPRNAVEVQLMRIWERILDVSPIGMRDNFFALGGDSLAAVTVIDRVEQLFGRQLPPDILWYQEGTIEALARALIDERGPPLWAGPVPIKANGARRPLFCPHIVGGHLFFYDNLAHHVDEDQPVYGLPARGFDGKTPADSRIEAMAEHCIGTMRQVQPRGPYSLAGYCSGGLIAFEMARQLHARGERVELLALCDSLAPGFHPLELARTMWSLLRLENIRLVQQRLYRFVLQNLGLSRLRKFRTVTEAHYWAFLSYRPQPYPGSAVLFRAANADDSRSRSLGWKKLVRAGVEICVIPCGHSAMVKEPMVRVLADKLETFLGRVADASRDTREPTSERGAYEPAAAYPLNKLRRDEVDRERYHPVALAMPSVLRKACHCADQNGVIAQWPFLPFTQFCCNRKSRTPRWMLACALCPFGLVTV
jgi:amino acid adenylation domain-containing protein